ncbi:MAG: tetratricopeptide repeat protein [Candidatus Saccharimonas sp.]|nr:tetratricopeptide repeat protein [Planctomycetaceae bacterium]
MSVLLVGAVAGCPGRAEVSSKGNPSGKPNSQGASAEDLLKSAIHQLRPENFSIAAAPDKPISLLNSWRGMVADTKPADANDRGKTPPLPTGWASPDEEKRLQSDKYDELDAVHIRDCLLTQITAKYLSARRGDELQRVQEVFQFVVRNIALRGDDDLELPLTTYLLLLTGRGSAEDRAWICASILKQLRIDSVIVRPSAESKPDDEAWLFGVLLNDRVHLFDPRLGIAVPSSVDATAINSRPATLDEIPSHPEWLQFLSARADQPYSIEADSLKDPQVMPIVETGFWSHRMSRLEQLLPTEDACVLFDPQVNEASRPGMIKRLQAACPMVRADSLKPWPYPERQREASRKASQALFQQIQQALMGFSAPITVNVDPQTKAPSTPVAERKMLKIRTDQLLGKFEDVTQRYLSIRHLEIEPNPYPEIVQLHRLAAEDAIYWSGVSKFEAEEYDAAVEQLAGYLKRFDRSGRWTFAARSLLAECHARQSRFAEAIAAVDRTVAEDPYRDANAVRVKCWKTHAKPPAAAPAK